MVLVQQQRRRHKIRRSNAQFRPIFWSGTNCFCSALLFLVIFLLYYAVLRTVCFVSGPSAAPLEEDWQLVLSSDPPYNRFAPKLDVVWARGWYNVLDPPDNVPLDYYNKPGRVNGAVHPVKWDEYFANNPKLCANQNSTNYIWVHASELIQFSKLLDQSTDCKNVTLISGEADVVIDVHNSFFASILDNVHAWYAQNVVVEHLRLFPIPIGLPIHYGLPGSPDSIDTLQQMEKVRNQRPAFRERNTRIFVDKFQLKDNQRRKVERGAVFDALAKCGYEPPDTEHRRLPLETWGNYSQHQFAPAPAGVGWDTYRVWEFLFFGTVPIVSASPWAEQLFLKSHVPVVIVDDWSEVCEWVNNPELYRQLVDAYAGWIWNAHHWLKPSLWVPRDQERMEMLCDMSPGCRESEKRRGRFPTKLSLLRQETHDHSSRTSSWFF